MEGSATGADVSDQLNRVLAKAFSGYIKDVTRDEASNAVNVTASNTNIASSTTITTTNNKNIHTVSAATSTDYSDYNTNLNNNKYDILNTSSASTIAHEKEQRNNELTIQQPGTGWGIVDADGSEDGYGVVGLAAPLTTDSSSASLHHSDDAMSPRLSISNHNEGNMNNIIDDAYDYDNNNASNDIEILTDARQLDSYSKQGKHIDMGPCHPGSKRISSGDVLLESKVIMITASGSYKGLLSFNGKEVFFSSTFDVDDKQKEDSAMVNLVKQRRMRRRRWVVSMILLIIIN